MPQAVRGELIAIVPCRLHPLFDYAAYGPGTKALPLAVVTAAGKERGALICCPSGGEVCPYGLFYMPVQLHKVGLFNVAFALKV